LITLSSAVGLAANVTDAPYSGTHPPLALTGGGDVRIRH